MMETMIPPQVGMRLQMKKEAIKKEKRPKEKKEKKEKEERIRENKREGTMLLSFYHTCASK